MDFRPFSGILPFSPFPLSRHIRGLTRNIPERVRDTSRNCSKKKETPWFGKPTDRFTFSGPQQGLWPIAERGHVKTVRKCQDEYRRFSTIFAQGKNCQKRVKHQGRKRNPNPNFLVRISSGGMGVFHVKGWGAKKVWYALRNPGKPNFLVGYPGILVGPAKSEKKNCVQFLALNIFQRFSTILARHQNFPAPFHWARRFTFSQ